MVVSFYASCFLTESQSSTATTLRWCFALNRKLADKIAASDYYVVVSDYFYAAIEDSSIDFGDFFKGPLPGKFLKLLGFLALSRLGVYIPLGGVNREAFVGNLDQNSLLSTLDSFSGLINAQIVFQLLAQVYPKLQDLQKREGEAGRKKILQYTRYASVGFAIVQAISQVLFLRPYVNDFSID
ncbi:preprotein translocase subunit SCY1, chloroplastic-like isoform X2 [Arachis stenosperma]|nr:preprotein translocase subunit SCY1, chloroplastic-like isoform X2 [Arachis stenosperma]XP_057725358.1 preprotein translocase subunit SCY1, chloroplastic-like isoform X2 [Arachis stenosperma]XP_057725359.1 preprotein translocase subunit SCY1, chloroplastic-like isoform X2 [Arachis stenosperma]